jgi:hypothetical protein
MLPWKDPSGGGKGPVEAPILSLLPSVRRTDEEFADDCLSFGVRGRGPVPVLLG